MSDRPSHNLGGLDIDVANYIAGKLGAKVELLPVTTANRIPYLQTKKADLVSGIAIEARHEALVVWRTFWESVWGLLLVVGVIGAGIVAPLRLHATPARAARLVLLGGFLLRLIVLLASEGTEHYRVAVGF